MSMDIKCPCCGRVFNMSADVTDHIREQVRTNLFNEELDNRINLIKETMLSEQDVKIQKAVMDEKERCSNQISDLKESLAKVKLDLNTIESEKEIEFEKIKLDMRIEYERKIVSLEQERDYYKDMKVRMSTKMVGESLEQHCENEFNKIRTIAFPRAYFNKDNVISKTTGSKGDYIFRDYDENNTEIVSIMFEMKHEMETNSVKYKNSKFFEELDKDRREKNCEYAVLVSTLEKDNDFYNQGIVDVSYEYEKMYVVRPQFFITIISLLRNASLNSLEYKNKLIEIQNKNLDLKKFEDLFSDFKISFDTNYSQADKKINAVVDDIDKIVNKLNKMKTSLISASEYLKTADNKLSDIDIKTLTANL